MYRTRSWVHHACIPQMMIITSCLSHTSATFSLTAMHLTRQFSSRQRDWQGHNEAWQSAPAWFVWRQTPERFSDLDKLCAPGGADAQRAAQWDQEEIKRKALEQQPCQAIEMKIIGKEGVSPDLMPPLCSPQEHRPVPIDFKLYFRDSPGLSNISARTFANVKGKRKMCRREA